MGGYKAKKGVITIITAHGKNSNETMKTAEEDNAQSRQD